MENVMAHPFFEGIDWNLLQNKHVMPPYIPEFSPLPDKALYPDLESMMADLGKAKWLIDLPPSHDQKYFYAWYDWIFYLFLIVPNYLFFSLSLLLFYSSLILSFILLLLLLLLLLFIHIIYYVC
jgi:hypothetical protein